MDTKRLVEERRDEVLSFLAELVRMPTENRPPVGDEGPGQHWLAARCRGLGLRTEVYELDEVPGFRAHPGYWPRKLRGRKNVIARWPGRGGGRSLLFSGHMDVAPAYPLPWKLHGPFDPVVEEGRLYGRGSADMKAGLAAAFFAIKLLKESGFEPRGDVLFESVCDEEYAGANGTLAGRIRGDNADFAIVPEPTGMNICPASYGAKLVKIAVSGPSGMPYGAHGVYNPVFGLGRLITVLKEFEDHWNAVSPPHPMFKDERLNVIIYKVLAGDPRPEGQMTVPPEAWLSVIIQTRPPTKEEEIDTALQNFFSERLKGGYGFDEHPPAVTKEFRYMVPADMTPDEPGVKMLTECAEELGEEMPVRGGPYSCDLFLFHQFGIPAVLLGPRGDNYHGKDEWVSIDDTLRVTELFAEAIRKWCG